MQSQPYMESILILVLAMFGLLTVSLCVQPLVDDWIYMSSSGRTFDEFWTCAGAPVNSLAEALKSCGYHYLHSNGRLTDKLLILFSTEFPARIGRILCVSSFGIGLLYLLLLCGGRDALRASGLTAVLLWLIMVLLPWQHYILSMACEFNYLLPCGLCLPVMFWFLRSSRVRPHMCLVAIGAGMMHESFSLGILAGMGAVLAYERFRLSRAQWTIGLFFLGGTLVMMLAPGTFVRMDNAPTEQLTFSWVSHTLLTSAPFMLCALTSLAALAYRLLTRKSLRLHMPTLLMLAIGALGSLAIGFMALQRGRAYWFGDMLMIALTLMLLRSMLPCIMRPHRIAGGVLGALLILWFAWGAVVQYRYNREAASLEEAVARSGGCDIIWVDSEHEEQVNPWLLRIPQAPVNVFFYNLKALNFHYHGGLKENMCLPLPTRFRGKHFSEWDSLPGGAGVYGSYPVFYVPSLASMQGEEEWSPLVTFDVGAAALGPTNLMQKLRGVQEENCRFASPILRLPSRRFSGPNRALFADPTTGIVPDTLYFIYPQERPRRLYGAPITRMER